MHAVRAESSRKATPSAGQWWQWRQLVCWGNEDITQCMLARPPGSAQADSCFGHLKVTFFHSKCTEARKMAPGLLQHVASTASNCLSVWAGFRVKTHRRTWQLL